MADLVGDKNGTFNVPDIRAIIDSTPLAQFKHLPAMAHLIQGGGGKHTRGNRNQKSRWSSYKKAKYIE